MVNFRFFKCLTMQKNNYLYNAAGVKVSKTVTNGNSIKTTKYLDGFQYVDEKLEFFPTAEGYVKAIEVLGNYRYNYVYNYTDHLGNIRLSYTKDPNTGELEVLEENHYYPFGLKHPTYESPRQAISLGNDNTIKIKPTPRNPYQYKYQGQERQDELGLNWDSFKWRNYDYAIGRFMSVDPLSEKYSYQSPYNFAENRVVDGRELEGLEWIRSTTVNEDGTKTHTLSANIKVYNNTQTTSNEDIERFRLAPITDQMKESFNGKTSMGDQVVIGDINYEMVTTEKPTSSDYYIEFTNQLDDDRGNPLDRGSGKTRTIGDSQSNRMQVTINSDNITGVAAHEINHSLGNRHQNDDQNVIPNAKEKIGPFNLQYAPTQLGNEVIPEQRDVIIENIPELKDE